jgi:hypothetical protein
MSYSESELIEEFFETFNPEVIEVKDNPHSAQCVQKGFSYDCRNDYQYIRIMDETIPRSPYRRRNEEKKSVVHNGQRKLLIAEIEFLTRFSYLYPGVDKVLYVGAAPGTHINYLSKLFSGFTFYLYDKSEFKLKKRHNIEIFNKYFTDKDIKDYPYEKDIFFISDIRRSEKEESIEEDMKIQENWVKKIRPAASSLKFRLPYDQDKLVKYMQGDNYLPVFGTKTTTETRLFIDIDEINVHKEYDSRAHEEQMFYFNTVLRPSVYPNPVPNMSIGLDYCYDCTSEVYVLWKYLKFRGNFKKKKRPEQLSEMIRKMSVSISHSISNTPKIIDVDELKKY